MMFPSLGYWLSVKDGDPRAYALFKKHYTFQQYKNNRRRVARKNLFAGPGFKTVLLGTDEKALFVWRKFIDASGQTGVNCAVFRNEGERLSSEIILEAEVLAWARWPGERLYTYVSPGVKSVNPGYCFKKAGWTTCGAG